MAHFNWEWVSSTIGQSLPRIYPYTFARTVTWVLTSLGSSRNLHPQEDYVTSPKSVCRMLSEYQTARILTRYQQGEIEGYDKEMSLCPAFLCFSPPSLSKAWSSSPRSSCFLSFTMQAERSNNWAGLEWAKNLGEVVRGEHSLAVSFHSRAFGKPLLFRLWSSSYEDWKKPVLVRQQNDVCLTVSVCRNPAS